MTSTFHMERDAAAAALDNIIGGLEKMLIGFTSLRQAVQADGIADEFDFDPMDPANKYEVGGLEKFTERGVEICYRLFDAGKTRYAVSALMGISFGAAKHRQQAWEKAGGLKRKKMPL